MPSRRARRMSSRFVAAAPAHRLLEPAGGRSARTRRSAASSCIVRLAPAQPRAERVELAVLAAGRLPPCVVHGRCSPSCSHIASTMSWAIRRNVVSLPPDIVRKPVHAVAVEMVDDGVAAADVARVVACSARSSWNSGRAPAQTRSARAWRKPGTSRSPSSSIWSTSSCVTGELVGVGGADVGRADHADRADRDQDVAVRREPRSG